MVDNTFFQKRMILGQYREFAEYPSGLPHDQPDKPCCNPKIEEVHRYMVREGTGENRLVGIQPVSEYQKYGHKSYCGIVPFGVPAHKDQEGRQEVDYQAQIENSCIDSIEAGLEIDRLFRDIGVPDQHELVEPEIGPEDGEGKHELSKVMQMLLIDVWQVALVLEIDDEKGHQRQPGYEGATKRIPAIHRGEPVRLDAHQPEPGHNGGNG